LRRNGVNLRKVSTVRYFLYTREKAPLERVHDKLSGGEFSPQTIGKKLDRNKRPYYSLIVHRELKLIDLAAMFKATKTVTEAARKHKAQYEVGAQSDLQGLIRAHKN
jgi:hypothetical protein